MPYKSSDIYYLKIRDSSYESESTLSYNKNNNRSYNDSINIYNRRFVIFDYIIISDSHKYKNIISTLQSNNLKILVLESSKEPIKEINEKIIFNKEATVFYNELEGGFFYINIDDNNYVPIPWDEKYEKFKINNTKVICKLEILDPQPMTIFQFGKYVKILEMNSVEDEDKVEDKDEDKDEDKTEDKVKDKNKIFILYDTKLKTFEEYVHNNDVYCVFSTDDMNYFSRNIILCSNYLKSDIVFDNSIGTITNTPIINNCNENTIEKIHIYVRRNMPFNKYPYFIFSETVNGESINDTLVLKKGKTYVFQRTDDYIPFNIGNYYKINNSNIIFYSTGTKYLVNNVASIVNDETLTFTIPSNFENNLYYYSYFHSFINIKFNIE